MYKDGASFGGLPNLRVFYEFEKEQSVRLDHFEKNIQSFPEVFQFFLDSLPREEFQHCFVLMGEENSRI